MHQDTLGRTLTDVAGAAMSDGHAGRVRLALVAIRHTVAAAHWIVVFGASPARNRRADALNVAVAARSDREFTELVRAIALYPGDAAAYLPARRDRVVHNTPVALLTDTITVQKDTARDEDPIAHGEVPEVVNHEHDSVVGREQDALGPLHQRSASREAVKSKRAQLGTGCGAGQCRIAWARSTVAQIVTGENFAILRRQFHAG